MRETVVCTTIAIVCGLSAAVLAGMQPRGSDGIVLDPGALVLRHFSPGEEHHYQISLAEGEFARVVVEQKGIDVVVQVRDADDEEIDEFQEEIRPYGEEDVDVVAAKAGLYTLTVVAGGGATSPGLYSIRLDRRRPATAADRLVQESRSLRTSA